MGIILDIDSVYYEQPSVVDSNYTTVIICTVVIQMSCIYK